MASVRDDERLMIVTATANDTAVVLRMIKGLAEYERLSDRVVATEAKLREQLFGPNPAAEVCLAYVGEEPVGFGRQLLAHVAKIGVARGCDRMNWAVLPWNESAIDFYCRLGAEKVTEWEGFTIEGAAFERLARDRE